MGPSPKRMPGECLTPVAGVNTVLSWLPRVNWRHLPPPPRPEQAPDDSFPGWAPSSPGISHLQRVDSKLPGASGHITPKTAQMPTASLLSFKGHVQRGNWEAKGPLRSCGRRGLQGGGSGLSWMFCFSPCFSDGVGAMVTGFTEIDKHSPQRSHGNTADGLSVFRWQLGAGP